MAKRRRLVKKIKEVNVESETQLPIVEQLKVVTERYNKLYEASLFKSINAPQGQNILGYTFTNSITKKVELIREVDKIKGCFLYQAIMDLFVNDTLSPNTVSNDIINLTSENTAIGKELEILQETVDFDGLALQITEDFMSYGEYFLGVESVEGEGVTEIVDNIDQSEVVAIYKGSLPQKYLKLKEGKRAYSGSHAIDTLEPDKLAHFVLNRRKLRIKVEGETTPEYVRIGRPLFFGTFDLLKSLQLMSNLVPASYLQRINNSSILGIQVPENTDPKDAFKICRKYEGLLNKAIGYDPSTGDMTVADILTAAGKVKVIPIYDNKGNLTKVDPRNDDAIEPEMFQEMKKDIMGVIGVPYSFLYGGDILKGDQLKQFARYVRKLVMIQNGVANGFKQIARIHVIKKGLKPAPNHIQLKFTNALISVDELDKLEFLDTVFSSLQNLSETVTTIATNSKASVDGEKLGAFLNRFLRVADLDGLFKFPTGDIKPAESVKLISEVKHMLEEMQGSIVSTIAKKLPSMQK